MRQLAGASAGREAVIGAGEGGDYREAGNGSPMRALFGVLTVAKNCEDLATLPFVQQPFGCFTILRLKVTAESSQGLELVKSEQIRASPSQEQKRGYGR